jgi:hypothetical protein
MGCFYAQMESQQIRDRPRLFVSCKRLFKGFLLSFRRSHVAVFKNRFLIDEVHLLNEERGYYLLANMFVDSRSEHRAIFFFLSRSRIVQLWKLVLFE